MSKNVWYWIADEAALIDLAADFPISALLATIGVCIFFLSKGADWMVDGAVCLAQRTGLPRIVIGATIISLGTTTPEAFVSVTAAWMGNPGLALGNGVGSIICDTGLIFGICCLLTVMPVKRDILNRTGWVQVGSATLLVCISLIALATTDGEPVLQRWVGIFFLMLLVCYLFASYVWAKNSGNDHEKDPGDESLCKALPMIVAGLAGVIVGSRILVPFTGEFAGRVGVPDDIIAATMVAFGTSVPELVTAIVAISKGQPEITVGNIVGADVLNCLFVIGAAAAASPLAIPPTFFTFHFPAMIVILYSFRIFIFLNKDGMFKRWQGAWILGAYILYLVLQFSLDFGPAEG